MRRWTVVVWMLAVTLWVTAAAPSRANAAPSGPCTDEYVGPDGGTWGQTSNWSAGVPGPSAVVCWAAATTVVVTEGGNAAASIATAGSLSLLGAGTLRLVAPAPSALSGVLRVGGTSRLELQGAVACASASLEGGEILDDGSLECPVTVAAGTLAGTGSVAGPLVNEGGTVEPGDGTQAGGLSASSYRQGAGGTLAGTQEVQAAGASAHLLRVTGAVSVGGTVSIAPGSLPSGFPLIASSSEPQGSFTTVKAPSTGAPWTVAYGPTGALAVPESGTSLGVIVTGTKIPGSTVGCAPAPGWEPRGGTAWYSWDGPLDATPEVRAAGETPAGFSEPPTLIEELHRALRSDQGPTFALPGSAAGVRISCSEAMWVPAGGISGGGGLTGREATVRTEGAAQVQIGGPHATRRPRILGRPLPGHRLKCTPGAWEGAPSSFTYAWQLGVNRIATGPIYPVGRTVESVMEQEQGETLTCLVTAHFGALAIPAEARLTIPGRPQPTLCPRRPVALVSVRRASGALLLFGAATQPYFGERAYALRRGRGGAWHRVGSGRVNGSGYFELRVSRRLASDGTYRIAVGRRLSRPVAVPGLLQIVSDRSRNGESKVVLRLSRRQRGAKDVTVSSLSECTPEATVASARLPPGGDLVLPLRAQQGSGPGYFLATVGKTGAGSVELIVPALPQPLPG